MNILIVSPEAWSHIFVSKHHYAIHLAKKGHNVYFLNPPEGRSWSIEFVQENLWQLHYPGWVKGFSKLPSFLKKRSTTGKFRKLEKLCDCKFNLIWNFDSSVFYHFDAIPENVVKIFHRVDLNQNYHANIAARTADICLCTTSIIKDDLDRYNSKVFIIPHGLNLTTKDIEVDLPGHNSTKAVYIGNLNMQYLDWEALNSAAELNDETDFIFIGPGWKNDNPKNSSNEFKKEIKHKKHVHCIGKIEPSEINNYCKEADILLLAYQEKHQKDQANPHKMLEYLFAGTPIVSTKTLEFNHLDKLILFSERNSGFPLAMKNLIDNYSTWNDPVKQTERMEYAKKHDYTSVLISVSKILSNENISDKL